MVKNGAESLGFPGWERTGGDGGGMWYEAVRLNFGTSEEWISRVCRRLGGYLISLLFIC